MIFSKILLGLPYAFMVCLISVFSFVSPWEQPGFDLDFFGLLRFRHNVSVLVSGAGALRVAYMALTCFVYLEQPVKHNVE